MKAATEFVLDSYKAKITCPHCGHANGDWLIDPRGANTICDNCDMPFLVPENIEITIN